MKVRNKSVALVMCFLVMSIFFNTSCSRQVESADSLCDKAIELVKAGGSKNIDEAIKKCDFAMKADPKNPKPYQILGDIYIRAGKGAVVIEIVSEGLKHNPDNKLLNFLLLRALFAENANEEVIIKSTEIIGMVSHPGEKANLYHLKGGAELKIGKPQSAVESLRAAKKEYEAIGDVNAVIYNDLGYAYYIMDDYKKAEKLYGKALEIDATYVQTLNNFGVLYSKIGQLDKALDLFERSIKVDSDQPIIDRYISEVKKEMKTK